jgi:aminoglycoside phosphotransferase (APT) family kinase protein
MHPDQLTVSPQSVRALVDHQFPAWQGLPITAVASQGTVNAIFRIGDHLAARFPLRDGDAETLRRQLVTEADAARELTGRTRFPTPTHVAIGEPGFGYPLPWSVQTWIPGIAADEDDPAQSTGFAHDLAEFIADVRALDTRGRTFLGLARSGRGGDLTAHDAWMETCLARTEPLLPDLGIGSEGDANITRLRQLWAAFRKLPRGADADVMTHGDLIPGNVLVAHGRLAGVLDVGGLGPADPALDLVGAWHLLDAGPRQVLRELLECDDLQWQRGKAWAFEQAMGAFWYYRDSNPAMSRMGRRTLERIIRDESLD